MFEPAHHPLLSRKAFFIRLLRSSFTGFLMILFSLGLGMWGYHHYEGMGWLDAYVNAAMILSGMGPLNAPQTEGGKLFAGTYALFSGIVFLLVIGVILSPVVHRFIHKFHVTDEKTTK